MHLFDPAVAQPHAALVAVGEVDVELRRQGEGRRDARIADVRVYFGTAGFHALSLADVGGVEVERPPLGRLQRNAGRGVVVFRCVVVDPGDLQQVGVVGIGLHRLLDFVGLDDHAARERIFVGQHERQTYVVLERRVEFGIARLVGVVRNLHALRVEAPEARPFDRAGILRDERVGAVLGEGIGDVGIGKEREVVLPHGAVFAPGAGVFAAQTRHGAPAAQIGLDDAVGCGDLLGVVEAEAVGVVAQPCSGRAIFVERVVVHDVAGVFGARAQRDFGREVLFQGQRGRQHVVACRRTVAVERVERPVGRRDAGAVVVVRVGVAEVVVGQELERRAQRVDLPDVVEGRR